MTHVPMMDPCSPKNPGDYPSDCEVTEGLRTIARIRAEGAEPERLRQTALAKAALVRLLLLDVDGVLSDGSIFLFSDGMEGKAFNTQDGFGLKLLVEAGIDTGVITARNSDIVARRARDLKMRFIYQGVSGKLAAFKEIQDQSGLKPFEIAYMGDDWLDLALLTRVGFAAAPANAVAEVKDMAHFISKRPGGTGAVREVCDFILEAKGLKKQLLQEYLSR